MPQKPVPTRTPSGKHSTARALLRLWPYVRRVRTRLASAAVVAIVASSTGLVFPLVLKWMVDGPIAHRDPGGVWLGALYLLLLGIGEAGLFGLRRWLVARPLASVEARMRSDLYRHLQRLPVAFHDRWASGQLLSRGTTDLMLLRQFLAFPLTFLLVNGTTIVIGFAILLAQRWTLGLVLLLPAVPLMVVCAFFEQRYSTVARQAQDQVGDVTTVVEEGVLGIRIIKGFGRHRSQARAFHALAHTLRATELAKARLLAMIWAVIMTLPELAIGGALVLGTLQVANGELSTGTLVAFLSTALALRWPIESIGFLLAMTQESATATERYFEVMDAEEETERTPPPALSSASPAGPAPGAAPTAATGTFLTGAPPPHSHLHPHGTETAATAGTHPNGRGSAGTSETHPNGAGARPARTPAHAPRFSSERPPAGLASAVAPARTRPGATSRAGSGATSRAGSGATSRAGSGAENGAGGIVFESVAFRYPDAAPDAPPVLRRVDLHIGPGETMALVGATGSGKTTLTALVPRLHEPTGGRITLDGEDITAISRERLRTLVAVAFEEPTLFSASVAENVLMGAADAAGDDDLHRALDVAQAGFAHALPQGTATQVGEQGLSLSGGQRQRLALARAVVGRPRFLVLDDPLSALDVHTEALVEAALRRVLADTTALVVAHRPSTVQLADRVALLSQGRIAAVGTHQELLRDNEEYAWLMSGADALPQDSEHAPSPSEPTAPPGPTPRPSAAAATGPASDPDPPPATVIVTADQTPAPLTPHPAPAEEPDR